MSNRLRWRISRRKTGLVRDQRSTTLMEFALVGPMFMIILLLIFEVAYDQFLQEVLESTLDYTAHQVAVGLSADQGVASGASFVTTDFCSNDFGLLNCNNVYVRVQHFLPSAACSDLYPYTTGNLPATNATGRWALVLNNFVSPTTAASGTATGVSDGLACFKHGSSSTDYGYCNAGPSEFIVMSAIYIAPSFVTALLPSQFTYTYNGHYVRAPFASEAFETEAYTPDATAANGPQC